MSDDNSLELLMVPTAETSWLRTGLAHLCSASTALLLGATALASVTMSNPVDAQPAEQQKPNILFIMGDDIGLMQPGSLSPRVDGRGNTQHRPHRQ